MIRKIILITFGTCLLISCQSEKTNPVKEAISNNKPDSNNVAVEVGDSYLEPPDSTYTGDYFERYDNGIIKVRGFFRFGKKHGKWMYWHPNGLMWSEAFFENDKMEGESKVYHPNGKLYYEANYHNHEPSGTWKFYDTTGTLVTTKNFDKQPSNNK
jgi:hypothetical protein